MTVEQFAFLTNLQGKAEMGGYLLSSTDGLLALAFLKGAEFNGGILVRVVSQEPDLLAKGGFGFGASGVG